MKKFFTISFVALFLFMMVGVGFAGQSAGQNKEGAGIYQHSVTDKFKYFDSHPGQPSQWTLVVPTNGENGNGDNGSDSEAFGTFDISAKSFGYGVSADGKLIPAGAAGGIGGAVGFSGAEADGFVVNGEVGGNVSTIGGGFSETNAYRFNPGGDAGIGVGSRTDTYAVTGAHVDVNVDPGKRGFGKADGTIGGFAAQGSLNGSIVGPSPRSDWDTDGYSAGVAGQGAVGGFEGGVFAISGPDYNYWCWSVDSKAGAAASAEIKMSGFSYSESYRYINNDNGFHTEGMGTNVGAGTDVTATGYSSDYNNGLGDATSGVHGGYKVVGGAATKTVQINDNGFAKATAVGVYAGAGSLNTTFEGSAIGYSNTSMTTHQSANGTISTASSGMQVTAGSNVPR